MEEQIRKQREKIAVIGESVEEWNMEIYVAKEKLVDLEMYRVRAITSYQRAQKELERLEEEFRQQP